MLFSLRSRVVRGPKREAISRSYNLILRAALQAGFSDAQCGFKAARTDALRALLPMVQDNGWFFDTELLVLAEHNGLRISEVPVDWVDDPDSRVHVGQTAREDLAGVARLAWEFLRGGGRIDTRRYGRRIVDDPMGRQLVVFALIGVLSTAVSAGLFLATRGALGSVAANVLAVSSTVAVNAWANRRYTFGRRGRLGRAADYVRAAAVYVVGLAVSTTVLLVLEAVGVSPALEFAALGATWALTTLARFAVLSRARIFPTTEVSA